MIVTESTVRKLTITAVKNLDPVAVMVEDHGPGVGKITITCFNDCWTHFWGAMGERHTLTSFFAKCSTPYLAGKLKCGISDEINEDDEEVLTKALRTEIIKRRRDGDIEHDEARDLWDSSDFPVAENGYVDSSLFYNVFGDDWWDCRPKKPNPDYEYLCRIIDTVKEAFSLPKLHAVEAK